MLHSLITTVKFQTIAIIESFQILVFVIHFRINFPFDWTLRSFSCWLTRTLCCYVASIVNQISSFPVFMLVQV